MSQINDKYFPSFTHTRAYKYIGLHIHTRVHVRAHAHIHSLTHTYIHTLMAGITICFAKYACDNSKELNWRHT